MKMGKIETFNDNLEEISFRNNSIDSVECDFSIFQKLKLLDISSNRIKFLKISKGSKKKTTTISITT